MELTCETKPISRFRIADCGLRIGDEATAGRPPGLVTPALDRLLGDKMRKTNPIGPPPRQDQRDRTRQTKPIAPWKVSGEDAQPTNGPGACHAKQTQFSDCGSRIAGRAVPGHPLGLPAQGPAVQTNPIGRSDYAKRSQFAGTGMCAKQTRSGGDRHACETNPIRPDGRIRKTNPIRPDRQTRKTKPIFRLRILDCGLRIGDRAAPGRPCGFPPLAPDGLPGDEMRKTNPIRRAYRAKRSQSRRRWVGKTIAKSLP